MISAGPETTAMRNEPFPQLVERLSELSVKKHYEAYRDVDWEGPDARIDPDDPRFSLTSAQALSHTDWYRGLRPEQQSRLGLAWICEKLKYGIEFESLLSIGLLEFTQRLPNGSPAYRYAMHEVIEESQHSLMFQQFINQAGQDPVGMGPMLMRTGRRVARYGGSFPELFFFFVLSGEIFIDDDNRKTLRERSRLHPLFQRLLQIHVTEEARHVCFAERYLEQRLPALSRFRTFRIGFALPRILEEGQRLMLQPSARMVREHQIPRAALQQAFGPGTPHQQRVREICAPVRELFASHRAGASARDKAGTVRPAAGGR